MTKVDRQFSTDAEQDYEIQRKNELNVAITLAQVENKVQVADVLEQMIGPDLTADVLTLASDAVTRPAFLTQLLAALEDDGDLYTVVDDLMTGEVASAEVSSEAENVKMPVAEVKTPYRPIALLPPISRFAETRNMAVTSPIIDKRIGKPLDGVLVRRGAKTVGGSMGSLKA